MSSFTKSQSEAIRHVDGPLLVLAGPGSGKTTVVTKRVQYLVQDCSISPSSILVITFTKAAATEMKERFTRLMEQQARRIWKRIVWYFSCCFFQYFEIVLWVYGGKYHY
mgnify:CR=1 FL=1